MSNLAAMLRLPANLKSTQWQILAGPILILLILSMMVLPLPAFILDLLFTFNIALSIMVLLVAMFTQRTLEFAAFPTILLFTTLLRLALNVASTRIILMEGHTGAAAAGKVVEAFGHFLVGGNFAIGIVVFVILVIIRVRLPMRAMISPAECSSAGLIDGCIIVASSHAQFLKYFVEFFLQRRGGKWLHHIATGPRLRRSNDVLFLRFCSHH